MSLTCPTCRRLNPARATYCYHDGSPLAGQATPVGGPVRVGTQPFPDAFVFPSGRRCRNFDELGLGCVHEWPVAVELLVGGHFRTFLQAIGRPDLASVADQAAQFPDPPRGLDMLLEKLPTQVVLPPRLRVEPQTINLGEVPFGQDASFEVHLANQGMRLLYGAVAVDQGWLSIGGGPGVPEKSFDCEHELDLPIHIQGKKLKAGKAPQEGRVLISSNGGSAELAVRILVPVKPFPSGLLAGAKTQRELAELAFRKPLESAPSFESGQVARWYADNGWTYPVQGPVATGLAALQQFLEACGLTTPPRLEIDTTSLEWEAAPGARISHRIHLKAVERKPAFAYATSDKPWLRPGTPILDGRRVLIPLEIPSVPASNEPRTLTAQLTIVANGRQRFQVPVSVQVKPAFDFGGDRFRLSASRSSKPAKADSALGRRLTWPIILTVLAAIALVLILAAALS